MEIEGYKCFNKNKTNRYGMPFLEHCSYHVDGEISFGNNGNGFHMCKHLSDVFRYFNSDNSDINVAKVIGSGKFDLREYPDDFEGYYDMYAVSDIYIERFLNRNEIIDIILNSGIYDVCKFLRTFKCTEDEIRCFMEKFQNNREIISIILYYFFGYKEIYSLDYTERDIIVRKLLK